jgi:hypothetical protein
VLWVTWIVGFATLGSAAPATSGLGSWFAWGAVGTLQPSMVADVVEGRRFGRRHLAMARVPSAPVAPPPPIRGPAPVSPAVPPGRGIVTGR